MSKKDKNYVSIWFWMLVWFVMSIPILNVIMFFVWAFTGENESRKNYFKASIVLFLFGLAIMIALLTLGAMPFIINFIREQQMQLSQPGT